MNIFEKGTKLKLRFDTDMGNISIEDLWDIPLSNNQCSLDMIAKQLSKLCKESEEESFVEKPTTINKTLELKFEIVKEIIANKLKVKETAEKAADTKAKKAHLMTLIVKKQDEELEGKSEAELKALLDDL